MRGVFYLQSFYSLLQSLNSLETLVQKAKENDYDFVALSDDNLYGMPTFLKLCHNYQIKPILGLKINFLHNNQLATLLIYAKNDQGIKNLIQISTIIKNEEKPQITLNQISHLGKDLFALIPGENPFFDDMFFRDQKDKFFQIATQLQKIFDELVLGISYQNSFLELLSENIIDFANHFQIPYVPINKTCYDTFQAQPTYQILAQMENKKNDKQTDLSFLTKDNFDSAYNAQTHKAMFAYLKKLIFSIKYQNYLPQKMLLPSFVDFLQPQKITAKEYLKQISYEGLRQYIDFKNPKYTKYQQRLDQELQIIADMEYDNYFLIVGDVVRYAKKQGILVGPGRGSSSGSLVCFCLQITEIDPLQYDLIFERFLNPQRKTMPDIDLDFPDNTRDLIIQYVCQKYGTKHVASIITFGRFVSQKAIINELVKFMPTVKEFQTKRVLAYLDKKSTCQKETLDLQMKNLLTMASYIEGIPRFTGTHPAGIILSQMPLDQIIPLQKGTHNNLQQTQWEASFLESIGLLKIDFLGLRSLTLMNKMVLAIQKTNPHFGLFKIPLNDTKTFELLQQGKTIGIFQLESYNAKIFLQKMMPQKFEDLIALLALNRPGPIDSFNIFLKNRHQKTTTFFSPLIDFILQPTYGIILYQEQIMQIVAVFAKYSLAQADLFRRAISKKGKDLLLQEKNNFIAQSKEQGRNLTIANKLYDYILKFANYGFNKSHSVAYSLISYRMAYLKANHFIVFVITLLNDAIGDATQTEILLKEVIQKGIIIEPPHIFSSQDKYYFKDNKLFLPLTIIKGINVAFCQELMKEQKKLIKEHQKLTKTAQMPLYYSFKTFKQQLFPFLTEPLLTNLIFAGTLDKMGLNRNTLEQNKDLKEVKYYPYSDYEPKIHPELPSNELVIKQKKTLGFGLHNLLINQKNKS
ncbi:DNA polymerase III subunit alpha ['Elaeagnus angustifolia' witches'-broom phytoplasma]|uniref:DNA-directed DNA polymerase n=1 Tax='Elaeagnus angustifolia' witches'-broom phytoplasma TaxID=1538355 RepID=A0ABS5V9D2_9MOLU|nr:DNA polymerase III subunit alpha ['Elaeagnus angustifolia' witches'-broom phytoplasma]MCX2955830.1 DNA polymerase III subunit alpha [Candidatus Phytoplasma australiense]